MRIIDSNKDFYDYCQNIYPDNTFTFDRRNSYMLTKEEFAKSFYCDNYHGRDKERFITLQINHHFWLFKFTMTKVSEFGTCLDYKMELLANWTDFNSNSVLILLSEVKFNWYLKKANEVEKFVMAIRNNDLQDRKDFDKFYIIKDGNKKELRTIPILKNIGIASLTDAFEIYSAFESYFSEQKTNAERTEAIGTTNNDKITSHGFDLKKSFRNTK